MLFEQLVTTVAGGSVEVQGLSPSLDQDLMYRLMYAAPAYNDMDDHHHPAYTFFRVNKRLVLGRTFFRGIATSQTNYIIGSDAAMPEFKNNPALLAFIANAEGMLHDKNQFCPKLPVLDYEDGRSRFAPVFENENIAKLAEAALAIIVSNGKVAVHGISQPFRFLIPLFGLMHETKRLNLSFSVNSSFVPKDEEIKLFVFPSTSDRLLKNLASAEIQAISIADIETMCRLKGASQ